MKPIFSRGPSLQFRLILAVLVAIGVIIADSRLGTFSQIRTYMDTAVSPFYFVSNGPRELLDSVSQTLASRDQLELENRALRQELILKNSELLMMGQYRQENARLRELLGSPLRQDEQKMVTQVISTVNDPYSDQVVIDKGSVNGVYEGQPVISDKGVVGQVIAVAKLTSRVLLSVMQPMRCLFRYCVMTFALLRRVTAVLTTCNLNIYRQILIFALAMY